MNKNQQFSKPDNLILASMLDVVIGSLGLILGVLLLPTIPSIMNGTFFFGHMGFNNEFMSLIMSIMLITLILVGIPLVFSGIGLYLGIRWSKSLHTLSWIPTLLMFPLGTFIGIFAIWLVQTRQVSDYFLKID